MILASFLGFMLLFVLIGGLSYLQSKKTAEDYLVANRSMAPWLVGLSAVATNNSGYMFTGMIGFTYSTGLSSIWLMIGWIVGDLAASLSIMKRLRQVAEQRDLHSFGGLLADWHGQGFNKLRRMSGLLIVIFLGAYAAAQFNAGSKALHVLFDWDLQTGAILGAVMVLFYSFMGGIRASIWTDVAQSFVMLLSMCIMMAIGISHVGGADLALSQLNSVNDTYMNWFPDQDWTGILLFILGWVFAGFGVAGQPHIVVRYIALDNVNHIGRFRLWYYSWFVAFYSATVVVGLLARLLLPDVNGFDAELALPSLALQILPDALVGLMLAGLFSATMSTADSLVLSCTASVSRDLFPHHKAEYWQTKMITVIVVISALCIALWGYSSVFQLVLIAWGLLAAAFAPLLLVYALGKKPGEIQAITMMLAGIATLLAWRWLGLSEAVYEILPAMLAGLLTFMAFQLTSTLQRSDHS
ncbi:MAG: sodium/proline symporter [Mariprofundus sp.]|nr:sodium/proline symporter [Mariprofundus sp.]